MLSDFSRFGVKTVLKLKLSALYILQEMLLEHQEQDIECTEQLFPGKKLKKSAQLFKKSCNPFSSSPSPGKNTYLY